MSSRTIGGAGRRCAQAFLKAAPSPVDQSEREVHLIDAEIRDQLDRFKIWAGSLGVFASGRLSADYRLRGHKEVKDVILRMLDRLVERLESLGRPNPHAPESRSAEPLTATDSSSESSLELSDDTDEEPDETDSRIRDPTRRIRELMTNLYKITAVIKKPFSSREDDLVLAWSIKKKAELRDELDDLRSYVDWWAQRQLPEVSPEVRTRIIETSIRRRQRLLYRREHSVALEGGVNEWLVPRRTESIVSPAPVTDHSTLSTTTKLFAAQARGQLYEPLPSVGDQASSVPTHGFSQRAKSVVLSEISPSVTQNLGDLDVPPPPRQVSDSVEVICPYCNLPLPREVQADRLGPHWRRHVIQDISPYICLFDRCDTSLQAYRTKDDWINHMKRHHTAVWSCQTQSHSEDLFTSEEDLAEHFRQEHHHDIPEQHIPFMLERSRKPMPDPFAVLASRLQSYACPFAGPLCAQKVDAFQTTRSAHVPEFPEAAYKKVRDHIASHLESIALLSLPHRDDVGSQGSSDRVLDDRRPLDQPDDDLESGLDFDEFPQRDESGPTSTEPVDWSSIFGAEGSQYPSFPPADEDKVLQRFRSARKDAPASHIGNLTTARNAAYDATAGGNLPFAWEKWLDASDSHRKVRSELERWAGDPQERKITCLTGPGGSGKTSICRGLATLLDQQGRLGASFFFNSLDSDRNHATLLFPTIAAQLARRYPKFRYALTDILYHYDMVARAAMGAQDLEPKYSTDRLETFLHIDFEQQTHRVLLDVEKSLIQEKLMKWRDSAAYQTLIANSQARKLSTTTIDELIEKETDEELLKALKQQKRLLRNREAALASRQRKKKHTEDLEIREKSYTQQISLLENKVPSIEDPKTILRVEDLSLHEQLTMLVTEPWSVMPNSLQPVFIVIDGVDECRDRDVIRQIRLLSPPGSSIHLLMSGRPEVMSQFAGDLYTLPIDYTQTWTAYLEGRFAEARSGMKHDNPASSQSSPWPTEGFSDVLVETCIASFEDARAVADIVDASSYLSEGFFKSVREGILYSPDRSMDKFYLSLTQQFAKMSFDPILSWAVLKLIVELERPLSMTALAELFGGGPGSIYISLRQWRSVVDVPFDAKAPARVLHEHFRRFVLTHSLSMIRSYRDDDLVPSELLPLDNAFEKLQGWSLRPDVLSVYKHGTLRDEISEADVRQRVPESHAYLCEYWIHHSLRAGGMHGRLTWLFEFRTSLFLPWLEMLSWLRIDLGWICGQLSDLRTFLLNSDHNRVSYAAQEHVKFLEDAEIFIRYVGPIIEFAPLQVYYAARLFQPLDTRDNQSVSLCKTRLQVFCRSEWASKPLRPSSGQSICVSISEDEQFVIAGSRSGEVEVWNTVSGQRERVLEGDCGSILSVSISPDNQKVASKADDGIVTLWSLETSEQPMIIKGNNTAPDMTYEDSPFVFSADGKFLITGCTDMSITFWDTATGQGLRSFRGHAQQIVSIVISPDGRTMASLARDMVVKLWDLVTGEVITVPALRGRQYTALAFSPDGHDLALGSTNGTIDIWGSRDLGPVLSERAHTQPIKAMAYTADGKNVVSTSENGFLSWLRLRNRRVQTSTVSFDDTIYSAVLSRHGRLVVSCGTSGSVRLSRNWRASRETQPLSRLMTRRVHSLDDPMPDTLFQVTSLEFGVTGRRLASGSNDGTVRIWDIMAIDDVIQLHSEDCSPVQSSQLHDALTAREADLTTGLISGLPLEAEHDLRPDWLSLQDHGIDVVDSWIRYMGEETVRLPDEYKSGQWAVRGNLFAIANDVGLISVFVFDKIQEKL